MLKRFVEVSYSQIAVFPGSTKHPFNMWTELHSAQGFAWRRSSVGFRTVKEDGDHAIDISFSDRLPSLNEDTILAVDVPFEIFSPDHVVVASVASEFSFPMLEGLYQLRYQCGPAANITLNWWRTENPRFLVLRSGWAIPAELKLEAEPAI